MYSFIKKNILFLLGFILFLLILFFQTFILFIIIENRAESRVDFIYKKGFLKLENQTKIIYNKIKVIKSYTKLISRNLSKQDSFDKLDEMISSYIYEGIGMFQIRLINEKGKELIRYEIKNNKILKASKLQDKSDRYYFKEMKNIRLGDLYISKLDLNVENGKIEIPYRATTRIGQKIKINGKIYYLIINYDLSKVLNNVFHSTLYDIFLVEKNGEINFHIDKQYSFSKQKKLNLKINDILKKKQYITKMSFKDFNNDIVIAIKSSQLKSIRKDVRSQKKIVAWISLIIVILMFFVLYVIFILLYRIKSSTELKDINKNLTEEIIKNKEQSNLLIKQSNLLQQQSKLAMMGEMIAAISHQWRQPLNEISINIQSLQYDYEDNLINKEFLKDFIDSNQETIQFMSKTIDDFRNFFKIEKETVRFSVKNAINSTISILKTQLKNNNIIIELNGDDFYIEGFQGEFQQVILNIINNAKDALIENKVEEPKVKILLENQIIKIQDNARGIQNDIIDRIFEPYFTTKEQGKGTGIGLYMSKMIIETNMDGKLSVKNIKNGAEFRIEFE